MRSREADREEEAIPWEMMVSNSSIAYKKGEQISSILSWPLRRKFVKRLGSTLQKECEDGDAQPEPPSLPNPTTRHLPSPLPRPPLLPAHTSPPLGVRPPFPSPSRLPPSSLYAALHRRSRHSSPPPTENSPPHSSSTPRRSRVSDSASRAVPPSHRLRSGSVAQEQSWSAGFGRGCGRQKWRRGSGDGRGERGSRSREK